MFYLLSVNSNRKLIKKTVVLLPVLPFALILCNKNLASEINSFDQFYS